MDLGDSNSDVDPPGLCCLAVSDIGTQIQGLPSLESWGRPGPDLSMSLLFTSSI